MAFVKQDMSSGQVITSDWADNIQTQYDEVKAELAKTSGGDIVVKPENVENLSKLFKNLNIGNILSGNDGDVVISSTILKSYNCYSYNNLTINATKELVLPGPVAILGVAGTLTLNGNISVSGRGASGGTKVNGGGNGGNGGGILIVIANKITGTGKITANGNNGANGVLYTTADVQGVAGTDGSIFNKILGKGLATTVNASPGDSALGGTGGSAVPLYMFNAIMPFYTDGGGAGGASGCSDSDTYPRPQGGGGGCGLGGNGGKASEGYGQSSPAGGSGGGGGGGGGAVILYSLSDIPSITVEARGGNGGNGTTGSYAGYGGGGGGGGIVLITAPSSSATVSVAGGTVGTSNPLGTGIVTVGVDGTPGYSMFVSI